jgi:hypothetical protein
MRKPAALFLCLLASFLLYSCFPQNSSSEGQEASKDVRKIYYQDGTLHKEMAYKNGLQDGVSKEYYKSGKIFQEVAYKKNLRNGVAKRYFESGLLSQETPYVNDKMHGVQKRYRRSGDLMTEVPYYEGNLCIGLKEYTIDGKLKQRYPTIEITPIDNILLNGTYTLKLKMSDGSKGVEYFVGRLAGNKYIGVEASRVFEVRDGVGEINFPMPRGSFIMEEVNIIARVKTSQSNYYITQNKFHLAIENR